MVAPDLSLEGELPEALASLYAASTSAPHLAAMQDMARERTARQAAPPVQDAQKALAVRRGVPQAAVGPPQAGVPAPIAADIPGMREDPPPIRQVMTEGQWIQANYADLTSAAWIPKSIMKQIRSAYEQYHATQSMLIQAEYRRRSNMVAQDRNNLYRANMMQGMQPQPQKPPGNAEAFLMRSGGMTPEIARAMYDRKHPGRGGGTPPTAIERMRGGAATELMRGEPGQAVHAMERFQQIGKAPPAGPAPEALLKSLAAQALLNGDDPSSSDAVRRYTQFMGLGKDGKAAGDEGILNEDAIHALLQGKADDYGGAGTPGLIAQLYAEDDPDTPEDERATGVLAAGKTFSQNQRLMSKKQRSTVGAMVEERLKELYPNEQAVLAAEQQGAFGDAGSKEAAKKVMALLKRLMPERRALIERHEKQLQKGK